jgi:hypothetical protein
VEKGDLPLLHHQLAAEPEFARLFGWLPGDNDLAGGIHEFDKVENSHDFHSKAS